VKKNWSHELKYATPTTKTRVAKMRAEPKTIGIAHVNISITLPQRCHMSDKLSVLFEPHHVRWFHSHFLFLVFPKRKTDLVVQILPLIYGLNLKSKEVLRNISRWFCGFKFWLLIQ